MAMIERQCKLWERECQETEDTTKQHWVNVTTSNIFQNLTILAGEGKNNPWLGNGVGRFSCWKAAWKHHPVSSTRVIRCYASFRDQGLLWLWQRDELAKWLLPIPSECFSLPTPAHGSDLSTAITCDVQFRDLFFSANAQQNYVSNETLVLWSKEKTTFFLRVGTVVVTFHKDNSQILLGVFTSYQCCVKLIAFAAENASYQNWRVRHISVTFAKITRTEKQKSILCYQHLCAGVLDNVNFPTETFPSHLASDGTGVFSVGRPQFWKGKDNLTTCMDIPRQARARESKRERERVSQSFSLSQTLCTRVYI